MSKIYSIQELISEFKLADEKDQSKVLKRINIDSLDFEAVATWREGGYTRNCLVRTPEFEFILLCWDANAETPIHDHGGQDCWVYQISGDIEEVRYTTEEGASLAPTHTSKLSPGNLTYMNDKMGAHKLTNISKNNQRAMTLHIYASPIDQCRKFNTTTQDFEQIEMSYDTIVEEIITATK